MKIGLTEKQLRFIEEALGDEIPPYMRDIIQKRYKEGEKFLKRDIPKHTNVIPNLKVEVQDENITNRTIRELIEYFSENILSEFTKTKLFKLFDARNLDNESDLSNLEKFENLFEKSLGVSLFAEDWKTTTPEESNNTFKKITWFYSKEFKLPVSSNNDINNPIFSQNKSGISTFLKVLKKIFGDFSIIRDINVDEIINDKRFVGLRDPIINYQTNLKKISDSKLFLYISDKPDDKLRMSVSKFYDSCQNIYTGGDEGTQYNKKLLSNVFDENSKVAYLIFNAPFRDKMGNPHPFTSVARTVLRVNKDGGVMFDKVYPNDMKDLFHKIIEDKTGLKNVGNDGDFYDYKGIAGLPAPYMDKYKIRNVGEMDPSMNAEYIEALSSVTDFNPKELEVISDNIYKIGNEEWAVYTYDEAVELTRDFFNSESYDLLYDRDLTDILYYDILLPEDIKEELNIDEDDMRESGYEDIVEYLREVFNIETLGELVTAVKNGRNDSNAAYRWLERHLDVNNVIEYFGGEFEAMSYALAPYDGYIHEHGNLVVFRRD
jgi:hypothetical protein